MTSLTKQFTDKTVHNLPLTSHHWDFGDGEESTEQNPEHTYAESGLYDVTMTVSDGVKTESVTRQVLAYQDIYAEFSYTVDDARNVHFYDSSFSMNGLASWYWTFGDGADSTDQNPTHTYASDGPWAVTLVVTDNEALTANKTKYVDASAQSAWEWEIDLSSTLSDGTLSIWQDKQDYTNGLPADYTVLKPFTITVNSGSWVDGTGVKGTGGCSIYWNYDGLCHSPTLKAAWGRYNAGGPLQKITGTERTYKLPFPSPGPVYGTLNVTSGYIGTGLVDCAGYVSWGDGLPWYPDDVAGAELFFYRSTGSGSPAPEVWICAMKLAGYGHHVLGES